MNVKVKFSCPWDIIFCENADDMEKVIDLLKTEKAKNDSFVREIKISRTIEYCILAYMYGPISSLIRFLQYNEINVERL